MTLNLEDLEATAQALTYRGGDEQMLALDAIALIAKLREAEAVIANVEDFVTRHYLDTRMGQAVLALTYAYKHTNREGGDDGA